jgi:hypothetical protein
VVRFIYPSQNFLHSDDELSSGKPIQRQNYITLTNEFLEQDVSKLIQTQAFFHSENNQNELSCAPTGLKNGPIEASVFLG